MCTYQGFRTYPWEVLLETIILHRVPVLLFSPPPPAPPALEWVLCIEPFSPCEAQRNLLRRLPTRYAFQGFGSRAFTYRVDPGRWKLPTSPLSIHMPLTRKKNWLGPIPDDLTALLLSAAVGVSGGNGSFLRNGKAEDGPILTLP